MAKITKQEIKDRYQAGTMGYETCVRLLMRDYAMTEVQADDWLVPRRKA